MAKKSRIKKKKKNENPDNQRDDVIMNGWSCMYILYIRRVYIQTVG